MAFDTTPGEIVQAALEGVAYRLADVLDAIGGLESVVATGHALLVDHAWLQILADVLGRPVEVSAELEGSARGAAACALEQLGLPVPDAPVARVVEPRLERHEIHQMGREEQRRLMRFEEAT
ncbi:MAG TPA: FGGY-family carbohydrate kinase [Acidimicrobiales bacterium]|nr:FGGY-family carbohydrate kinase [Acidimicrobiales bacterium]